MTLLIACICIYGFHLSPAWYVLAVVTWYAHLAVHEGSRSSEWAWLRQRLSR